MIADCLLGIDAATPESLRPVIRPLLSSIMRFEQESDRLRKLEASIIKSESDARLRIVTDELAAIEVEIEKLEIQTALSKLARAESLDPELVIAGLADRCQYGDDGLTILDRHGVPTTFSEAVLSLGGDA